MSDKPPILDYETPQPPQEKQPLALRMLFFTIRMLCAVFAILLGIPAVVVLFSTAYAVVLDGLSFAVVMRALLGLIGVVVACFLWHEARSKSAKNLWKLKAWITGTNIPGR